MTKQPFWKRRVKSEVAADAAQANTQGGTSDSSDGDTSTLNSNTAEGQELETMSSADSNEKGEAILDLNGSGSADENVPASEAAAESNDLDQDPVAAMAAEYDQEIKRLGAEVRENYDKYLRALAEGENIKKRALKDRADVLKYAGESIARDVLEVLDDLENAVAQGGNVTTYSKESFDSIITGFKLVLDKFHSIMQRHGIKGESAVGQQLDPTKHEALAAVPTADVPPGQVINEFRKPYFFKDKLLRPGQVVVSAAMPGATPAADAGTDAGEGDGTENS